MSARALGALGALSGFLSVALGAFAAHALAARLEPRLLGAFETGARLQLVHALAIVLVALALERRPSRALAAAGALFVAGSVVFSGSLYALALTGRGAFGAVTPLGGLALLAGWLALAGAFLARPHGRA